MSFVRHRPSFAPETPAPVRKQDRKTHRSFTQGAGFSTLLPPDSRYLPKRPAVSTLAARSHGRVRHAGRGKARPQGIGSGRRRESGIAVAREQPPGERTTSLSQVPPLDPGSLMRVFGGLHRRVQQSLLDDAAARRGATRRGARCGGVRHRGDGLARAGPEGGSPLRRAVRRAVEGVRVRKRDRHPPRHETSPAVVAIDAPHKIASCRVYWADSRDDPWKARNAIPVETASFGMVLERVVELRALVARLPGESSQPAAAPRAGASRTADRAAARVDRALPAVPRRVAPRMAVLSRVRLAVGDGEQRGLGPSRSARSSRRARAGTPAPRIRRGRARERS